MCWVSSFSSISIFKNFTKVKSFTLVKFLCGILGNFFGREKRVLEPDFTVVKLFTIVKFFENPQSIGAQGFPGF